MFSTTRRRTSAVVLLVGLLVATTFQSTPASAAPAAPTGLTPAPSDIFDETPPLHWNKVAGADYYQVQVSTSAAFTSLLLNVNTHNSTYVPAAELPNGQVYWRVATVDAKVLSPYASSSFTKDPAAGPDLESPADGAQLVYPNEPPLFSWEPTPGAKSYILEIDDAPDFVDPKKLTDYPRTTSYTPVAPITPNQPHYWRVRGASLPGGGGVLTDWSVTRQLEMVWDTEPTLESPKTNDGTTPVDVDTRLQWSEVKGAQYYDIEVGKSTDFSSPELKIVNSRTTRLDVSPALDNGAHFWRVRAKDPRGNVGPWFTMGEFERHWPGTVTLDPPGDVAPPGTAVDTNIVKFEWEPVDKASHYILQVGSDANFSPSTYVQCSTPQTTWSPYSGSAACGDLKTLPVDALRYWRVLPVDLDSGQSTNGIFSQTGSVIYRGSNDVATRAFDLGVEQVSPANCLTQSCAFSSMPTLDWNPVQEATLYMVYVATDPNFTSVIRTYTTTQTELTPAEELPDNNTGQAYYWHVRPCRTTASCGPDPTNNTSVTKRAFAKHSLPTEPIGPGVPVSSGDPVPTVADQPTFRWESYLTTQQEQGDDDDTDGVTGDDNGSRTYRVQVSAVSTFQTLLDERVVSQERYTPWDRTYPEGPIYWRVRSIDGSGNELSWSEPFLVTKASASPTPTQPTGPVANPPAQPVVVHGTPRFKWNYLPHAAAYELEVYKNADTTFSPTNRVLYVSTAHTAYVPTIQSFPPGDYVWRIRRKDADTRAGAWTEAAAFRVTPADVTLLSPATGIKVSNDDVVFSWDDNVAGAASYRFERSSTPQFTSITEQVVTSMTSWAPAAKTADGTWYWRVLPLDPNGVVIGDPTPGTRSFTKDMTKPTVAAVSTTPVGALNLGGPLKVQFSERVFDVSPATFKIVPAEGRSPDPIAAAVSTRTVEGATVATLSPRSPLTPGAFYDVILTGGIRDSYGNRLTSVEWAGRAAMFVEGDSPAVSFSWDRDNAGAAHGGSFDEAQDKGARIRFNFSGTSVQVLGRRASDGGTAQVFLDGKQVATASFFKSSTDDKVVVFSKNGIAAGKHTLELRATGAKSAQSDGTWVRVDAFKTGSSTVDQTSAAVRTLWAKDGSSLASGKSVEMLTHKKDTGGAPKIRIRFRGTAFGWYGERGPKGGLAAVWVDGKRVGTADLYAPATTARSGIYGVSGLKDREHTLEIQALGTKQTASKGAQVSIDFLTVG